MMRLRSRNQQHLHRPVNDAQLIETITLDTREARLQWKRRHAVTTDMGRQWHATWRGHVVTFTSNGGSRHNLGVMLDDGRELAMPVSRRQGKRLYRVLDSCVDRGALTYEQNPELMPAAYRQEPT